MINDPFFTNYLKQQPSRQSRPVFVQQSHGKSSPKVVSVPVHFVSSEQPPTTSPVSKEAAALTIQRVFRGFLVRKSVKKISLIKNDVSEVERRINDGDVVELIRRDPKERLRVNETLMSLLLKLDSIRGVDFGVRDFRKAVIKKAIALQEKVDSIASAKNESVEIDSKKVPESSPFRDEVVDESMNIATDGDSVMNVNGETDATNDIVMEIDNNNCNPIEVVDECGAEDNNGEQTDDNKRNIQLLEKLMDDNEKMMKLMTQMFERNEMQTRMLNSLTQRVEQLEKAFVCDKSRRKKKKRHTS